MKRGCLILALVCTCLRILSADTMTPGSLALLARTPGEPLKGWLRASLRSDDPTMRIVAARVIGVAGHRDLSSPLIEALAAERDEDAQAEFVRDLLLLGQQSEIDAV